MSDIVYSTDPNWKQKCEKCGEPLNQCTCQKSANQPLSSQTAYISREKKGRAGKTVTTISKLEGDLKSLQKELQKKCATGGSTKNRIIEIQGDHRDKIADILREKGCKIKFSG